MTYSIRSIILCAAFCAAVSQSSSQEDYFNTAIVVLNGDPVLVTLDDLDNIDDVLMYLPDYFGSHRTKEEYVELLKNSYALGGLEIYETLRFIEFPGKSAYLSAQGVQDIQHIADAFTSSEKCLNVVVTVADAPDSNKRLYNITHSLRAFGVPGENIRINWREAVQTASDGIVKLTLKEDLF